MLALAAACSPVPYKSSYKAWTKGDRVYSADTFEAKLIWRATYLSPEFKERAREQIDVWKKTNIFLPPYVSYLNTDEEGVFLVSVYTPRGYPAINASPDDFWDLSLDMQDGRVFKPTSIRVIEPTPREARLFPYINRWSTFYEIKFPVTGVEKPFTLALRSAGATSLMKWK